MQIEEAVNKLKELRNHYKILEGKFTNSYRLALDIALNYIDIMHKEFDRLEGIEDNTAMLKYELEQKDKIIDLIADELRYQRGMGQDDIFCYDMCENDEGVVVCDRKNCKENIKEYFYKRAGEEDDAVGR